MKRLALYLLLSAGFLLALAVRAAAADLATRSPAKALHVAIVGDSHAQALGPRLARVYRVRGHTVSVVAEPGWSARRFRSQGTLRHRVGRIDTAVVILGGNHHRVHDQIYSDDIAWVLNQLRAAGASTIIWFGPLWASAPRYQESHLRTRNAQQRLVVGDDVRWVDIYDSTRRYALRRDGVHFRRGAYDRIVSDLFVPMLF